MLEYLGGGPVKQHRLDGGDESAEIFFLPETPGRLVRLAVENGGGDLRRDLSMRPKEYWETRPMPAKPHHWTAGEFAAHLDRHRFPPGTLVDRMRGHQQAIRGALVSGEPVPAEVMATDEGRAALEDAIMDVKSLDEGAFRMAQQKVAVNQFDTALSASRDGALIEGLVVAGVKLAAQAMGAEPQAMAIDGYPRPVGCMVVDERVLVKDTGWNMASLYGVVHEIDKGLAESIVRKAIREGELTFDESLWFMGSDWRPFAVVRCVGG